jgi:hypothetical protein
MTSVSTKNLSLFWDNKWDEIRVERGCPNITRNPLKFNDKRGIINQDRDTRLGMESWQGGEDS